MERVNERSRTSSQLIRLETSTTRRVVQVENTKPGEPWHCRAVAVREHNGSLRWDVEATRDGEVIAVTADTSTAGSSIDLQSEDAITPELDHAVRRHIGDIVAMRDILRQLPRTTEGPLHRSDRLRVA
jgi:hypothetical protein